ncbi:MAG: type IV pilus secretin PilQ [Desulfobacterota bacterium]|nr:type IV pilus secretin PilQ [Thermodesulfobacteriota bacterium]MDW8002163.1 type IV pilus secretin PilQ [Deltaproteobacteria bacterium]
MIKYLLQILMLLLLPVFVLAQDPHKPALVSMDFIDADLRNVLRGLAEIAKKNIVIAEDVKGKVTLKLDNVTWDEALDVIVKITDNVKVEEENIIRIITRKKYEEEKDRERKEREFIQKERLERIKQGEEFVTETIFLNYTSATEVAKVLRGELVGTTPGAPQAQLRGLLSEYGACTPVPWSNAIIIKDTKENVALIKKMIKEHDFPPAQVQIEARIVQASSDFSKELGVQWGATYKWRAKELDNKMVELTGNVDLSAAVGPGVGGRLGIYIGSVADSLKLDLQLSALEREGKGRVISNPKIITTENRPAIIKQGQEIPYQIITKEGTPHTEFKEAVLSLEVTPQVTRDNNVKLKIRATKDRPLLPVPGGIPIDKKETSTEVIVRDGETAVIGGIYEVEDSDSVSGLPFLRYVPLLKWFFKKETKLDKKSELLIFITPRIIKNAYMEGG